MSGPLKRTKDRRSRRGFASLRFSRSKAILICLPDEPIDAVFFLDSYDLLFHGRTLLAKLHEKLSPTGCIYVLDRKAREPLSRWEASHRRRIQPKSVGREMAEAGFFL
jgi:hypothetical protein